MGTLSFKESNIKFLIRKILILLKSLQIIKFYSLLNSKSFWASIRVKIRSLINLSNYNFYFKNDKINK